METSRRLESGQFRALRPSPRWLVASAVLLLVGAAPVADAPRPVPPLFGGIQVNEPDHDAWAGAVRGAGLDSVQVTLYARQGLWDAAELSWERDHPWVVAEIRAARRAGLRTVLVLRVALEHGLESNRHLWHGMIWPRGDQVEAWFERYRQFARYGVELATREGVDLVAIGSELSSMTSTKSVSSAPELYAYFMDPERVGAVNTALLGCADSVQRAGGGADLSHLDGGRYPTLRAMLAGEQAARQSWALQVVGRDAASLAAFNTRRGLHERKWRALIAELRATYDGPLTYAANFDQYAEVGFWDALDAVSVAAYFPLSSYGQSPAERRTQMRSAWARVAHSLEAAADGRPLLLLELGWTRRSGATVRPYSYERVEVLETATDGLACVHWATQPEDPQERVDALGALVETARAGLFPSLRGVQLWKLTTRVDHRNIEPFAIGLGEATDEADGRLLAEAAALARHVRATATVTRVQDEQLTLGEEIFLSECASCHGNRGKGDGPAARFYDPPPRDLTAGEWMYAEGGRLEEIERVVAEGVEGSAMEPFEGILSVEEIAAVARWVHEKVAPPAEGYR